MRSLFEEKQRFTQWWLWVLIGGVSVAVVCIFLYAMYVQFLLGVPWGDKPMSNDALLFFSLFLISTVVLMLVLLFTAMLEVAVDRSGVSYRYFPFIRTWRKIEPEMIQSYDVRTYYLKGYGVKPDFRGNRTINVKGNKGVEFIFLDGTKLLLGTQRPEELMHALKKMKNGSGE